MDTEDVLRFVVERDNERFEIIEGCCGEGFYVVRYVNGCDTHDYLAPVLSGAQGCAEQNWGVPLSAWREARQGEFPLWQRKRGRR